MMRVRHDLGLIPEAMFGELAGGVSIYHYAHSSAFDWDSVAALAFRTGKTTIDAQRAFVAVEDLPFADQTTAGRQSRKDWQHASDPIPAGGVA